MIFRSPHPDVEIPEITVSDFVLQRASELGRKPALVDGATRRTVTYAELAEAVAAAAGAFAGRGLEKGDVVAVCLPNVPEYAVAFHGVASAGGVVAPMSPVSAEEEMALQLKSTAARYVVTIPPLVPRARRAGSGQVEEFIVLGDAEGATSFSSLLGAPHRRFETEIDPRYDLAVLPYSSGTSGLPKAVMLTHYNIVSNGLQFLGAGHRPAGADTVIALVPFAHIFGMQAVMNLPLAGGSTIITMVRPDFAEFLHLVQEHRVTRADLVPPMVHALARHPLVERFDLSSLRVVMCSAAPLAADVQQAAAERLGCLVKQGFGMTEASPATHGHSDDPTSNKPGSIGPLCPNTEAKLVDPVTGAELGPDHDGEMWIRGPQVMKGYLNDAEATARTVDADGWLHTGDVGRADADGDFYVVGRLKELIKCGGAHVAPAQLEAVLLAHPAVADAAVIGILDAELGEVPKAFVVAKDHVEAQELLALVAQRVAPHKRLRTLEFVTEIPRAPTGKVLRRVLAEREGVGAGRRPSDVQRTAG